MLLFLDSSERQMATITLWLSCEKIKQNCHPQPCTTQLGLLHSIFETMMAYTTKVLAREWNWLLLCFLVSRCKNRESHIRKKYLDFKLICSALLREHLVIPLNPVYKHLLFIGTNWDTLKVKKKGDNLFKLYIFLFSDATSRYVKLTFVIIIVWKCLWKIG